MKTLKDKAKGFILSLFNKVKNNKQKPTYS